MRLENKAPIFLTQKVALYPLEILPFREVIKDEQAMV
jgi:hypothetical protein